MIQNILISYLQPRSTWNETFA